MIELLRKCGGWRSALRNGIVGLLIWLLELGVLCV